MWLWARIDLGRPEGGCLLHDPAQIDVGGVQMLPSATFRTPRGLVLAVQRTAGRSSRSGPRRSRAPAVRRRPPSGATDVPPGPPGSGGSAPASRRDQLEQDSGVLPHSGHLAAAPPAAASSTPAREPNLLHQLVGQPVHIPLGDGVVQQQFQDPVVRPARQSPGRRTQSFTRCRCPVWMDLRLSAIPAPSLSLSSFAVLRPWPRTPPDRLPFSPSSSSSI